MSNPVTPLTPEQTQAAEAKAANESYPHREAVALDIFLNESLGGKMDETISSRASRNASKGQWFGTLMSKFLNVFQRNHGPHAQAGDVERAEQVIAVEEKSGNINAKS